MASHRTLSHTANGRTVHLANAQRVAATDSRPRTRIEEIAPVAVSQMDEELFILNALRWYDSQDARRRNAIAGV